jgi:indole-3-glycerol phosphate synthase/phosphoribosylanthranilate isomerase
MPLVEAARAAGLRTVGVFDGADPQIAAAAELLGVDAVQVYGTIPEGLKERLGEVTLWSVCAAGPDGLAPAERDGERTVFDSGGGGTGAAFDWNLLDGRADLPEAFLAGGITPANAASAARVGAFGLDLSSGVEVAPGIKDPVLLEALFASLRPPSRKEKPCA